ncbi:MAG: nucleotidyl transferase AbiEii/AbiGii toxin family protein [Candidatus Falkowbacteria bacterium]|nr:nucleotidyl transferase AbiEii/AbiGii toxin family protein [Candidatus Falkowbacteria bacterium]
MLTLKEIEKQYPDNLKPFKRNILREYLQYKILEIIFNSSLANKLSFLGGTALRIVHGNTRFSEDLDFDNFNLTEKDFITITNEVKNGMIKLGFEIEIRNVFKGAFRCYLRISKILSYNNLSVMADEKILIQIDTAPHKFKYKPDKNILNKFDVFTQIFSTPLDILLSQKIYTIFNRKRSKGRDFFDTIFLLGLTKPNYQYLKEKVGLDNWVDVKKKLLKETRQIDLASLVKDVEPFLFTPSDAKKITLFREYIKQLDF